MQPHTITPDQIFACIVLLALIVFFFGDYECAFR